MTNRKRIVYVVLAALAIGGAYLYLNGTARGWISARMHGTRTVADAVEQYGDSARGRLVPAFEAAGVSYPPERIVLAALKEERVLELWAWQDGEMRLIRSYPVLAASGHAGPKLKEGDRQVPEGIYRIAGLNPNSSYHLSMKLDYPNAFDTQKAGLDGRTKLGGDIFIHGSDASVGCLAMGDAVIEELFVLVADVGTGDVSVVIAPKDPREGGLPAEAEGAPTWLPELYEAISNEFDVLAREGRS